MASNILWAACLWAASLPVYQMAPCDVDACLTELYKATPDFGTRVTEVARRSIGTRYKGDPLGEGPNGAVDKDPLMDLTQVDCVTFVEQTIALAASASYQDAFDHLQAIRYHGGAIAFENRNHFMVVDWVKNNAFCREITADLGVKPESVTRTIGRKHLFELKELPELAAAAVDPKVTLAYVPVSLAAQAAKQLPSPALVLLIGKVDWLFTLHCGFHIRDVNGDSRFIHAGSQAGQIVDVPFTSIFENTTRYIGFAAYALDEPKFD